MAQALVQQAGGRQRGVHLHAVGGAALHVLELGRQVGVQHGPAGALLDAAHAHLSAKRRAVEPRREGQRRAGHDGRLRLGREQAVEQQRAVHEVDAQDQGGAGVRAGLRGERGVARAQAVQQPLDLPWRGDAPAVHALARRRGCAATGWRPARS
jgi:hypothetical protein